MGFCRQLLFLSCILINLVCLSIAQLRDFNVSSCITESGNYADNGTYHKNLNSLLSSLPSNTNEDGFYNASAGQNSDRVEAMVLCRGDTDLENCRRCIHNSISKLPQLCPNNKEAIGWYDQCYLLYTNKSIVGDTVSKSPFLLQANGNNISTDDQFNQQFNQQVRELLEDLRIWSAAGRRRKVAAGNTTWPAFGSIYAMTQCTPVLSEEECSDCLEEIFGQIPQFANGKQGFKYLSPSCNFRFEIYPFFKDVPPPVTPAQLSNFVAYSCITESGNYTINGTYHTNLNTLLSSLSSNINKYGFYNATEGQNSDKVEAMVLCRGDTNLETCRSCINNSTTKLTKLCPSYKEAIGWYDQCFLWYTTKSIVGDTVSKSPPIYLWNTTDVPNIDQFNQQLRNLLETLRSQAAASDRRKFATGNTTRPDFGYIFALTQCTPILSEKECNDCLVDAIGQIPQCCEGKQSGWVLQPSCNFRFQISPFFGDIPTDVPPSATPGKDDNTTRTVIIIAIPIVTFLVVIIISICIFMRKKKQRKPVQNVVKHDDVDEISTVESLQYNFGTISIATDNFSDSNKLGQGGFGAVYQGRLPNGQLIAVKRLSMDSGQGELEFKNEFLLLAQLQHRNLVRLLGFSLKGSERLLIYEFVPNSSLDCFLFDPIKRPLLDWERRYKIIGGIARALLYLHEDSRLRIIHRDLKASNVLLDADMNPKISDFGMARLFVTDETQGNTSRIVGTFGYMAPEYAMHGQFSMKTDIFSFGVLVLEIVCGQKNNCFSNGESTEDLLSYAWKGWHEGTASNLVDPILRNGSGSMREMMRCIHIGLLCVQENVASRPTMASVVLMLNSSSLTLLAPLEPAFFNHSGLDPEMPQLQEHNSSVSSQSKTKSAQVLVNEVSITELYPS